jgi:hypothetical protein
MPGRQKLSGRKLPVKRLLDEVLPKKSPESKVAVVIDRASDNLQRPTSSKTVSSSSSMLKKHVERKVKKDQGTSSSPDRLTLLNEQAPSLKRQEEQKIQKVRYFSVCYFEKN